MNIDNLYEFDKFYLDSNELRIILLWQDFEGFSKYIERVKNAIENIPITPTAIEFENGFTIITYYGDFDVGGINDDIYKMP